MKIIAVSIVDVTSGAERSAQYGRYRVTLTADGLEHVLKYTVALSPETRSISWTPSSSILSDQRVGVLVIAQLSDMVVAFHSGENLELPGEVTALSIGPESTVIRL